jgi:Phage integrase family
LPGDWSGGSVKTHEARTVRLPRFVCDELGTHLADRPHGPGDFVFTAPLGGPLRESKFVPGYFKPAARAAGFPSTLRFYDLRHTAASLLIREGASVKAVQKQLGHATASITLDTYGHLFPDELDTLAARLEDIHARALADVWPHGGPAVVALRESAGQLTTPRPTPSRCGSRRRLPGWASASSGLGRIGPKPMGYAHCCTRL